MDVLELAGKIFKTEQKEHARVRKFFTIFGVLENDAL